MTRYTGKIFLGLILFFSTLSAYSQVDTAGSRQYLEIADQIMQETKVVIQARDMYEQAANLDPNNLRANYMAGETYLQTINKEQSTKYLLRVYQQDPNYKFNILYSIGRGYQYGYEFEKAIEYYQKYKDKLEADKNYRGSDKTTLKEVERRIYECKNGIKYKANPIGYSIVNLGPNVNSDSWDYAPVVNSDESVLIFTSRRRDGNLNENVAEDNFPYEDIFISKKQNGKWMPAQNIGPVINTKYHDSNLGFSPDGKTLFIYSDEGNGDIYYSHWISEDTWSTPQPLSSNINSENYNEKSVSISKDGKVLFFASNRPGGNGGFDIYYSMKNSKDEWGPSKNIGDMINTEEDEDGPFIQYDGKTLYFSSRGRDGMGGFDIFKSVYDSAKRVWTEPENMGYPVNTPDDDIYFVMTKDGKRGYYATVRDDGMGYNDIYMVTLPDETKKGVEKQQNIAANTEDTTKDNKVNKEVKDVEVQKTPETPKVTPVRLLVRVLNQRNGQPMEATVKVRGAEDNVIVPVKYNGNGIYEADIDRDAPGSFMLSVENPGYMFHNLKLEIPAATEQDQEIRKQISLRPVEKGLNMVLRNLYFNFNSSKFQKESYDELNKVVKVMRENPSIKVEIAGYTDNVGPADYNLKLSQQRANAVVQYLVKQGIDRRRLIPKGYGEKNPLASNDDEVMGRELNRRVEFTVLQD